MALNKKTRRSSGVPVTTLRNLIELKMKLDAMKPLYAQYDELLQAVLNSGQVQDRPVSISYQGVKWQVGIVDAFALKNTAWKSVPHRRFDISIEKLRHAPTAGIFRVKKSR